MFVITGGLGQTGRAVAQALLAQGEKVRLVVRRDGPDAEALRRKGADIVRADLADTVALRRAFAGASGAYLMNPPAYHSPDLFARAHEVHAALVGAAVEARVAHVVALSSIGAQHSSRTGNILTTHDLETRLRTAALCATVLRAPTFMENFGWSLRPVLERSVLPTMLLPVSVRHPMASARDIGQVAAALLRQPPEHSRIVEMHGPAEYSAEDAATVFSACLGRPVHCVEVVREDWAGVFASAGYPEVTIAAFCEMYDAFNGGAIRFEGGHGTARGTTTLDTAIARLLESAAS